MIIPQVSILIEAFGSGEPSSGCLKFSLIVRSTSFEVKVENRKVEGLMTYSSDQQTFKFRVNSGTDQEVWEVYLFILIFHQLIDAIFEHMGFYVTTENPNVMMKENHNTQSCEYIIICQDGLYIASATPEEILHMLKDKYECTQMNTTCLTFHNLFLFFHVLCP